MKLRPHHLLCIQKYTGSGYDEGFVSGMNRIVQRLKTEPDTEIELTDGEEEVCSACPHRTGGRCVSAEKVVPMDRGVLSACGFSFGQTDSWLSLAETAREKVLQTGRFERICANCQWIELCRNTRKGSLDGNEA